VLRRLIRRAFRHGNALGIENPFLHQLVGQVADIMRGAYPELLDSIAYISRLCLSEEERFAATLSSGLRYFQEFVEEARRAGRRELAGPELFRLYDTFGFPWTCRSSSRRSTASLSTSRGFRLSWRDKRRGPAPPGRERRSSRSGGCSRG